MLTKLIVKNFKSIGDTPGVDLELEPLTLLVGPNGGGKSSILEALWFFVKSGLRIDFQEAGRLIHRRQVERELSIQANCPDTSGVRYSYRLKDASEGRAFLMGGEEDRAKERQVTEHLFRTIFFISTQRGSIELAGPPGGLPPHNRGNVPWTGPEGGGLIPFLVHLAEPENMDSFNMVKRWAKKLGMPDLWAGQKGQQTNVLFRDFKTLLEGALASYGSRQALILVANLFGCPQESTFLIEEPEISLHPEAQVKLCHVFAEAIKERKQQIIATTHSYFLPRAIGSVFLEKRLGIDKICIYEVQKEPEAGTVAKKLEIDEHGYIKGWIPSFDEVERALLKKWLQTLPKE